MSTSYHHRLLWQVSWRPKVEKYLGCFHKTLHIDHTVKQLLRFFSNVYFLKSTRNSFYTKFVLENGDPCMIYYTCSMDYIQAPRPYAHYLSHLQGPLKQTYLPSAFWCRAHFWCPSSCCNFMLLLGLPIFSSAIYFLPLFILVLIPAI